MSHHETTHDPLGAPIDDEEFVTIDDLEATPDAPTEPLPAWPPTDEQVVEIAMTDLQAAATGRRRLRPGGYIPRPKPPAMATAGTRTHTRRRAARRKPRLPRPGRRNNRRRVIATYARTFGVTLGVGGALSAGGNLTWIGWVNRTNLLAPCMYLGAAITGLAITALILLLDQAAGRCNCREPHG